MKGGDEANDAIRHPRSDRDDVRLGKGREFRKLVNAATDPHDDSGVPECIKIASMNTGRQDLRSPQRAPSLSQLFDGSLLAGGRGHGWTKCTTLINKCQSICPPRRLPIGRESEFRDMNPFSGMGIVSLEFRVPTA